MIIDINKVLIICGIIFSFGGVVLMIEARTYTDPTGEKWGNTHKPIKKKTNIIGWLFIIFGTALQIVGTLGIF